MANLNLEELTDKFHEHGLRASKETLADFIIEGKFPFAVGIRPEYGRAVFYISSDGAEQWLKQFDEG